MHPAPLMPGIRKHLAQGFPEAQCAVANSQPGRRLQATFPQVREQLPPTGFRLPVAVLNGYQLLVAMLGHADERGQLSNYKGTCQIVVGVEDYATPVAMAEEIASLLPQARLKVLDGVRHYSPIEAPQQIVSLLQPLWSHGD